MADLPPKPKKKHKGSPIITMRLPPEILEAVQEACERSNGTRTEEPYTVSSFIRACIIERFDKYARARAARKKKVKGPSIETNTPAELPGVTAIAAELDDLDQFAADLTTGSGGV